MTFSVSEFKRLAGERGGGKWIYFFNNEDSFGIRCTEVPKGCDDHLLYVTNDMYSDAIAINPKEAEFIAYCGTHADAIVQRIELLDSELRGFVEYFGAIERGEVGGSRPTIRTFEKILLDKARQALERGE